MSISRLYLWTACCPDRARRVRGRAGAAHNGLMLTGRQLPDSHIFEIDYAGAVDAAEFEALRDALSAFLDANDPADILGIYSDIDLTKIEPKALWEDLKSAGLEKKVRRAALLTGSLMLKTLAKGASHFIQADVRVFGLDERDAALEWLNS
ncbi:hypothetical protein B7R54_14040 [Subtercola boreus]|uniref:STAS/SEC14 domain-containing protein n=2 Tax=Subtercola boreus TaxID=120213 RepID=A0A3E0VL90_9MICO|nr:hypothetical protein B7R54_14040 [Subtercola boreus]